MGTTLKNSNIEINQKSLKDLDTARKWAMFIAILGFIFLGLLITIGVIAGTFLSAFSGGKDASGIPDFLILILFSVIAIAYFFPVFYLFRFSKNTAKAVKKASNNELSNAIRNLKFYFVYIGVLVIIILSFYIIALILTGASITLPKGIG